MADRFCTACGEGAAPTHRFCAACGAPLETADGAPRASRTERRVVSVLFADLEGFTAYSAEHDSEEVQLVQERYFAMCRHAITRHGGTIEKFAGDAVMAVFGAPLAHEDDAERAVGAALEIAFAAPLVDDQFHVRVGIVTGEVSVAADSAAGAFVTGDVVNTASRLQQLASAGEVLVDGATKTACERAIEFESRGLHEIRGKAQPMECHVVVRVRASSDAETGVHVPFVGRKHELAHLKEVYRATCRHHTPAVISIIGAPGVGKTRLVGQFDTFVNDDDVQVWWHRTRCAAYGGQTGLVPLAEIFRERLGVSATETPDAITDKVNSAVERFVEEVEQRPWVATRLAHLLGAYAIDQPIRDDLFGAWGYFLRCLGRKAPTVIVIDDVHWADDALLDFIEFMERSSSDIPLFVLTTARPEFLERRPRWAVTEHFEVVQLAPLHVMEMMTALSLLPHSLAQRIAQAAEGIPLYATEMMRALVADGTLHFDGTSYTVVGEVDNVQLPGTLQSLITARLDAVPLADRRLLQDASVLGRSFTAELLCNVFGRAAVDVSLSLQVLSRAEFVMPGARNSSEDVEYSFSHQLVQQVAYELLSRKDRQSKHVAAAGYFNRNFAGAERAVEHLSSALALSPDDAAVRTRLAAVLPRAGDAALESGRIQAGQGYLERAIELSDDPAHKARIHARLGAALNHIDPPRAMVHLEAAAAGFSELGLTADEEQLIVPRVEGLMMVRDFAQATRIAEDALARPVDAEIKCLTLCWLVVIRAGEANLEAANEGLRQLMELMPADPSLKLQLEWLNARAWASIDDAQNAYDIDYERYRLAQRHGAIVDEARAADNVASAALSLGRFEEALHFCELATAAWRRMGQPNGSLNHVFLLQLLGRWDEALSLMPRDVAPGTEGSYIYPTAWNWVILSKRGLDLPPDHDAVLRRLEASPSAQDRGVVAALRAALALASGDGNTALAYSLHALSLSPYSDDDITVAALAFGADAAGMCDGWEQLRQFVTVLGPQKKSQYADAMVRWASALIAGFDAADGHAEELFRSCLSDVRTMQLGPILASVLRDYGCWLLAQSRTDEAAERFAESRELFTQVRSASDLRRLDAVEHGRPLAAAN